MSTNSIIKESGYQIPPHYAKLLLQAEKKVKQLEEELEPWKQLYDCLDNLHRCEKAYRWYKHLENHNRKVDKKIMSGVDCRIKSLKEKVQTIKKTLKL